MQIQNIAFGSGEHPSLYFRGGSLRDNVIFIQAGERVSFDTYFGSFTYTKYRDYTRISSVTVSGKIEGEAEIMLSTYDGTEERVVKRGQFTGDFSLSVNLDELPEKAFLYPVINAKRNTTLICASYDAEAEENDCSFAIAICTYKREEYVKRNLEILSQAGLEKIKKIIVVDNGNTLKGELLAAPRAEIFPNLNYGGSAGFTRGIMEALAGGFSHVILMDDDIEIFPEALERMTVFASILKEEYENAHFSFAMLTASRPYIQYEKGALWNGSHIESLNSGLDVRERSSLMKNLDDGPIGYGAWWCFSLPLSDVDKFGLPLPLFIKFDDVEYGTRTCRSSPIITMSGMAVSHADFDAKYSMHLEYYTVRNQLIMLAAHKKQSAFGCILRLMKVSAKHLFLYRYDAMPIILRAFRDFLLGADFIMEKDAEKLNREIMAMSPPAVPLSSMEDWDPAAKSNYTPANKNAFLLAVKIFTLGGHIIPNVFLKRKVAYAPLATAKVGDCFLYKNTIQYQTGSDTGYCFKKNSFRFFKAFFSCIGMSFKIIFKYRKSARSYTKNFAKLTSLDFWKKYLNL